MRASSFVVIALLVSCGDNIKPEVPDQPVYICGNGILDPGEDCDDHDQLKDTACDATCHFTCGNGVVDMDVGELCDTAIASGAGACPRSCDDGNACTDDVLNGSGCAAACVHSSITARVNGDGCCPVGADATNDSDCTAICGNGVVEAGETCDKGIVAGAGACPTACDDMLVCTTNVLSNAGTCQAACSFPPITMPMNGDGCCPGGANANNDSDCVAVCGNGVVEMSETCDTGIASGAGACPTACDDGMACTSNVLGNAGTCQAVCVFPPITNPANGDGCCPTGANANNDNDCAPVCGNGIVEPGEQCDDGNANNGDACANNCTTNIVPTAFRLTDLDLRDPHVVVSIIGCTDLTDSDPFNSFTVNKAIQDSIQLDGDNNGLLDFSPTLVFRPFSQTAATMPLELHFASCAAPGGASCTTGTTMPTTATATNMSSGTCLGPVAGSVVHVYNPRISSTPAPCFVSSAVTVMLSIGGIPITLHDAQIAAQYVGNPATSMANGLLRGFISEADANATIIPASFPLVGGKPLSSLLPGGTGACAAYSDKDTNNGVVGWWFYMNFPATRVMWTD